MPLMSTRRDVLKASALGLGAWVCAGRAFAQSPSPAEKLNIAAIGTCNRAGEDIKGCADQNIVALCDVDQRMLDKASTLYPKARKYSDWRKMLEQKDIDAVLVGTPDHMHALATMAAIRLGKHVYCEKPLTWCIHEARAVAQAAAKAKIATQMGTQIHAENNYRRVVELLQAQATGTVKRIHAWVPNGYFGGERPKDTPPVPAGLDWDLWLGPAPYRPYHPAYHPRTWRAWWDFGGGALSDMACHHMDLSHWAYGLRHPATIETEGPEPHPECPPKWLIVHYQYPASAQWPAIHLTWYHGGKQPAELTDMNLGKAWPAGSLFVGEKGMLLADYTRHVLLPRENFKDYKPPEPTIPPSIGHHKEWIRACKEGTPTTCNFDYAGALTETVLLGNVAHRVGKKLEWEPATMKVTNAPEAEKYLGREYRKGWEL